jgi:hypothetical protein
VSTVTDESTLHLLGSLAEAPLAGSMAKPRRIVNDGARLLDL